FLYFLIKLKEVFKSTPKPTVTQIKKNLIEAKTPRPTAKEFAASLRVAIPAVLLDIVAISIMLAVVWVLISPVLGQGGFAPGFDTPSHMYITERLTDGLKATGSLPTIDLDWYSGLEITHKLPLIAYIPMVAINFFTDNPMLTSRIFFLALLASMGVSMYLVVRLSHGGRLGALAAALIVPFSVASIGTSFTNDISKFSILVSFTRYFAFLLFPWTLLFSRKILDGQVKYWLALGIAISLILPSHPMVAALAALWLSVYAFFRIILEHKPLLSFRYFIYAFGLSGILSFWYLGPFLFEEPVWGTTLPNSIAIGTSMPFSSQAQSFGFVFALAVIVVLVFRYSAERLALLLASLFGFVYALGVYGPVFQGFAVLRFAYPFMMFFASVIGLAFLVFTSASLSEIRGAFIKKWAWRSVATVLVVALAVGIIVQSYLITEFTLFETTTYTSDELQITRKLRQEKTGGRVMPLGPPYGLIVHAIPLLGKKPTPEGQYTTIAPFYLQITALYDYLRLGYLETAYRKLKLWNSNYVMITPHLKQRKDFDKRKFDEVLEKGKFKKIYKNNDFTLFRNENPTRYIQEVKEDTLIIGQWLPVYTSLSPSSIGSGKSFFLDDYSFADLKHFKAVVLHGFAYRNKDKAESLIKRYVKQGGQVIVDAQSGDEFTVFRRDTFLGVTIHGVTLSGKTTFETKPNSLGIPKLKTLKLPKAWQTVYYTNLSKTFVTTEQNNRQLPVVGYKKIGDGKVYFLGANLLFYAFSRHQQDIGVLLNKIVDASKNKDRVLARPKVDQRRFTATNLVFDYESKRPFPAMISRTYSPHWKAYLDDKEELPITKMEGLMEINLPKGNHEVNFTYGPTTIHLISWIMTAFAVLFVVILLLKYRWVRKKVAKKRRGLKQMQRPPPPLKRDS
ncbi:MAG: hypothetical protein KAX16_00180, partial [Actinomycetia bacterium]|nr:hypothetical protein [Actinomycetes bacterium]